MRQTEGTRQRLSTETQPQRQAHLAEVDRILHRTLEPEPATVERLTHKALANREPRRPRRRLWQLAAAAIALSVMLGYPDLRRTTSPAEPPRMTPSDTTRSEPLRISNEAGSVIVTTPAGSKMIFLRKNLEPGDAS